ncbi:hypothetical protein OS121_29750 [Mycolicibacterium mucogenicum]|uniref:hypothetical protein n=1 Tax=Mycolicibacterium mucogenicum TaxID=56689 RepID=UPI00226A3F68|nr:hypothetical protein [Mycolicibacterium mucogenicum]MCX8559234.1 hypothetical protein [Mycolicibacterium mucogenicum]
MSVKKPSTADQVRSSIVRRPEGAAAAARAASTFQGSATASSKSDAKKTLVTIKLAPAYHLSLRQRALTEDTTWGALLSTAVTACLADPDKLVAAAEPYYRVVPADPQRTTAYIDKTDYLTLKQLALVHSTSVHALITAALMTTYPPK